MTCIPNVLCLKHLECGVHMAVSVILESFHVACGSSQTLSVAPVAGRCINRVQKEMAFIHLGPLAKELPWFMDATRDEPYGRIISAFLRRPTPLCAKMGPMIREIGRHAQEPVYCGYCGSEEMGFDIGFPRLPEERRSSSTGNGNGRRAHVQEVVCCKSVVNIRTTLDRQHLIDLDSEEAYDNQYGRVWECKLQDGYRWYSWNGDAEPRVHVKTWQQVANLVDIGSLVEVSDSCAYRKVYRPSRDA